MFGNDLTTELRHDDNLRIRFFVYIYIYFILFYFPWCWCRRLRGRQASSGANQLTSRTHTAHHYSPPSHRHPPPSPPRPYSCPRGSGRKVTLAVGDRGTHAHETGSHKHIHTHTRSAAPLTHNNNRILAVSRPPQPSHGCLVFRGRAGGGAQGYWGSTYRRRRQGSPPPGINTHTHPRRSHKHRRLMCVVCSPLTSAVRSRDLRPGLNALSSLSIISTIKTSQCITEDLLTVA